MRESGAELLGLHTAELHTVLPAEARALQNKRTKCNVMRQESRFALRRLHGLILAMGVSLREGDEDWKDLLIVCLSENAEPSALVKQRRKEMVTAGHKLKMAWDLSLCTSKVRSQNKSRD